MNNNYEQKQGGASITPSARRSIHGDREYDMVRYGLSTVKERNHRATSLLNDDQGIDVVDNVQSKLFHHVSPIAVRNKQNRRNSLSTEDDNTDNSSNVLSKSLPSTLPSHLSYSDGSELDEPQHLTRSKSQSKFEESRGSIASNESYNRLPTPSQRKLSITSPLKGRQKESNTSYIYLIVAVCSIAAAVAYYQLDNIDNQSSNINIDLGATFENNLENLQKKYSIDYDSIEKLKIGISRIFSKMDAGSFMFLYNADRNDFNPTQFDKLINDVASTAAKYLRHKIPSIQHTVLGSNLDMEEHSELMNMYKDEVDRTGVLLVKEIDQVPSELAMAFHYYCDEYNPLVKRSAIIFTLNIANCSNVYSDKKSINAFIEKCLTTKWNTIPQENMRPLLTRVVDTVIDMTQ